MKETVGSIAKSVIAQIKKIDNLETRINACAHTINSFQGEEAETILGIALDAASKLPESNDSECATKARHYAGLSGHVARLESQRK